MFGKMFTCSLLTFLVGGQIAVYDANQHVDIVCEKIDVEKITNVTQYYSDRD